MSTLKVNILDAYTGSTVTVDSTSDLVVTSTASATNNTSGALRVSGGISTQENLYVGGNAVITGTMTANGGTITLGDAGTDNVTIGGEINSDVIPDVTNTYDLGSSSKKWAEVHATTVTSNLTGDVTGNADTATTLAATKTIGGVAFDGSANINLAGVNTAGNQDTSGNATTATTLATARTLALSGDVSGSVSFDGSANATITATIADDSHNHTTANVDGLDTALGLKAPLASPALTGAPTAPTAAANTNTTQVATTAYVQTELTDLIGGAPSTLDTLTELATAIDNDSSYASTLTTALATKTAKTSNQSLSTAANAMTISGHTITLNRGDGTTDTVTVPDNNTTYSVGDGGLTQVNFTTADNTKLDGIEAGATADQTGAEILALFSNSITAGHIAAGAIGASEIGNDVVNSQHYAAGSIDNEHIADNAVNSEHYADGSIDRAHLAADIIDGTKIADDVINSEHYVAGSIDNEHIADNAINSEHYADNSIDALHLNVSGNGTTSQYLRSDGDGSMSWVTPPDTNTDTNTTYTAGTGMSLSGTTFNCTVVNTDTNTTYTAGTGMSLSGTTFNCNINTPAEVGLGNLSSSGNALSGSFTATGNITAYSDLRLKSNIEVIGGALDKVKGLRGVNFDMNGERSTGVIAQELELVLPEAVRDNEDGMKSVAYGNVVGLLIEAIKELSVKVKELENK